METTLYTKALGVRISSEHDSLLKERAKKEFCSEGAIIRRLIETLKVKEAPL